MINHAVAKKEGESFAFIKIDNDRTVRIKSCVLTLYF